MKTLNGYGNPLAPGYTFRGFTIPAYMRDALQRYIEHGEPPGDFLTAVISNNLLEAVSRADDHNQINLPAYVAYLYNEAPPGSWGSPEKMQAWIETKQSQLRKAA